MAARTQHEERDWSGCPIVEYDPEKLGGDPNVHGRRITPDALLDNFNDGYTAEEIATEIFEEPLEDVRKVLAYAGEKGWLHRPLA